MSESQKTIQLVRPYLGDLKRASNKLRGEVSGVSDKTVRWVGLKALGAVILSPGEIGGLADKHDIKLTDDLVDGLVDYLGEHLPETVDEALTVPTLPIGIHEVHGKPNQRLFTIASQNPVVYEERRMARLLTEEFFGVDEVDNDWPEWDYFAEIHFVRTIGMPTAQKVSQYLLSKPWLFPQTSQLGPVDIVELNRDSGSVGP